MSANSPIYDLSLLIKRASENPDAYIQLVVALRAMAIKDLDFDHSTKLLIFIIAYCRKISSPPAVLELVLQSWCKDNNDVDSVIGDLASMISVPIRVLTYVCRTLGLTSTLYGILETVIKNRKGCNIGFAITANRLITAFRTTPIEEESLGQSNDYVWSHPTEPEAPRDEVPWENLLQVAIQTGKPKNGDAYQYIIDKLGQTSQPVPRPKWANVLEGETLQLLQTTPSGQRPSADIVDRVVQKIESQIAVSQRSSAVSEGELLTSEEPSNLSQMIEMYVSTSIPEELELLDEYSNSNGQDNLEEKHNETWTIRADTGIGPERLWGPVNAMLDRDCSVNDGPCRMLSCVCRDLDQSL